MLRSPAILLLSIVAAAATVGCPKTKPPPQVVDTDTTPARPAVGVDSVLPDSTREGRGTTVSLEGWGFAPGARVFLDSAETSGVDVVSSSELTFRASEELTPGRYEVRVEVPSGEHALAEQRFEVVARPSDEGTCELQTVLFEFDESSLTNDAREALASNARCIELRDYKRVRVEGHADERGSTLYNLSLGQRRAESVKNYLENLGLPADRLTTLSYGEERPAELGGSEEAWRLNRRVEFGLP